MKIYQVRYMSEMQGTRALFGEYTDPLKARAAALWLTRSFSRHGLIREAKSVEIS